MSSLQIGLAVAGGVLLAAMVAHGAWRARRSLPLQATHSDSEGQGATQPNDQQAVEPALDATAFDVASFPLTVVERKLALDALIDVIAAIALEAPVSGEAALAVMPTRRAGGKPFFIEGFSDGGQRWEVPAAGQRYAMFQAGVQLANRAGALNDIEFSEFVMKTQMFCDAVNGSPDFPDMREEVSRARELDQFAGEHDAQLAFVLRARHAAWSPGYVQQNASRLGFVAGSMPGRMVLPAREAGSPPLLGLNFDTQAAMAEDPAQSAILELTLSLDVPQVDRAENAFARMREAALLLAENMDGMVTDDKGVLLQPEAMDRIGVELERVYDTLERRDLAAGCAAARRLFS